MKRTKKKFKAKKAVKKQKIQKQDLSSKKSFPNITDYYRENILAESESLGDEYPNSQVLLSKQITALCKKSLSTGSVPLLEELYLKTEDAFLRKLLAKKIYSLRVDYLKSFKEYSDRRLIMLAQRENLFDKWEGIYILGCFGGDEALKYLRERSQTEKNKLLAETIIQSIHRINKNKQQKKSERGF